MHTFALHAVAEYGGVQKAPRSSWTAPPAYLPAIESAILAA